MITNCEFNIAKRINKWTDIKAAGRSVSEALPLELPLGTSATDMQDAFTQVATVVLVLDPSSMAFTPDHALQYAQTLIDAAKGKNVLKMVLVSPYERPSGSLKDEEARPERSRMLGKGSSYRVQVRGA